MRSAGLGLALLGIVGANGQAEGPPTEVAEAVIWAYPKGPPAKLPEVPPGDYHVKGSELTFSAAALNNLSEPPDWFPHQHPPMPFIVIHSHPKGADGCAECHLPGGQGFLEVPDLAGLPAAYIKEQVHEFASGRRRSSETGRIATQLMIDEAKAVSEDDLDAAAKYFASVPQQAGWFKVVETDRVPVTQGDYYGWVDLVPGTGQEPIGGRIVELAENFTRLMISDPNFGVRVYVPPGTIQRGAALARRTGATGQSCLVCHGADARGTALGPPLANRSPSYLARMLWDIKSGARSGPAVALMQPVAAQLTAAEITDLAGYLASLPVTRL